MKNIRKFETGAERDAWLESDDFVYPNVVLTEGVVGYNLEMDYSLLPLHIEALYDLTVKFSNNYEYSKDNATWLSGTSDTSISANAGEKVYFRASGLTPSSSSGIGNFTISNGSCNICGNVMSMLYGEDYRKQTAITQSYAFYRIFVGCIFIKSAKHLVLPATTLANSCYKSMFDYCTNLVDAPALLPATTLANECYKSMFADCIRLVNAPALPATTLNESCYQSMFDGCKSLVNAPALPATTLANYCYIYMFEDCTSLVNAPVLPATTLAKSCYGGMFKNCTNLSYIKAMFTTSPGSYYNDNWVSGVASTGTFVKNAAATWDVTGNSGIPEGWTVETAES